MKFKKTYSNYIIAANIVIFILMIFYDPSISTHTLIKFGAKSNFEIVDFQFFRLFSSMFLHVTFYHILFNSLALYIIGNQVEAIMGKKKFLIVYFSAGIIGAMGSFITNNYVAAGASAGIFGLLGTHIYLYLYNKEGYKKFFGNDFLVLIAINIAYGFINPNIDNAAHIFGMIGGLFVTLFIAKQVSKIKFNQKIISVAVLSIIVILFGLKFNSYKYSEDYYLSKSVYKIWDEDYDEAYHLIIEGLSKYPDDQKLTEIFNLFLIEKK
ncbi:MAG: rhomboid family intramembrane serine protease [Clostridiales bacterium]|nr:rhomboid family intramembrane serine protease [Clostridiales bacterium]